MTEDREKTCPDCGGTGCEHCGHSGAVPLVGTSSVFRNVAAHFDRHMTPALRVRLLKIRRQRR